MPLEIEAKVQVDSHEPVRQRMQAMGAVRVCAAIEDNRIFDTADRKLLAGGQGLRVRSYKSGEGNVPAAMLTYKGPVRASEFKTREEIETPIEDPAAMVALLKALSYVDAVRFEKRRESWELAQCKVELDEVPHLGCFVEVEGRDELLVREVLAALGLDGLPMIRQSYVALLAEHCQQRGLSLLNITF